MYFPGSAQVICISEADVPAFVVGKIEVVRSEWFGYPVGYADQRGSLDVVSDTRMQIRGDDGALSSRVTRMLFFLYTSPGVKSTMSSSKFLNGAMPSFLSVLW